MIIKNTKHNCYNFILDKPANISLTLQREGHKATLICTAEGRPQPNFEIFSKRSKLVYKGSTYTFDIVKSCDFGNYTCKATNILGSAISHDVHVQKFKGNFMH